MKRKRIQLLLRPQVLAPLIVLSGCIVAALVLFGAPSKNAGLKNCKSSRQFKCYESHYNAQTNKLGSVEALKDLRNTYNSDSYVQAECHQFAHVIGRTAFIKYGSLAAAYAKGDSFCWSGYYHGVTEEAIGKLGASGVKSHANDICAELAKSKLYSFDHYNCAHGMGHGFLTVANFEVFDGLKTCDILVNNWERESCYGGIYMENVMVESRGGTTKYLRPDQPMYPCTAVEATYKQQCYLMQSSYILQHNGYNFQRTFELCRDSADKNFVATCYESIGRDASGSTVSNVNQTLSHCQKAPDASGLEHCMLGAVRDFVSYYHDTKQAKQLCQAFGGSLVTRCNQEVTTYYSTF